MPTQRRIPQDRIAAGEEKEAEFKPKDGEKSNIAPAVPAHIIFKLLAFTLAMIVVPIASYFLTLNSIFKGNSTLSGATAAITANLVLISYIIVAMKEDTSEDSSEAERRAEAKASFPPKSYDTNPSDSKKDL